MCIKRSDVYVTDLFEDGVDCRVRSALDLMLADPEVDRDVKARRIAGAVGALVDRGRRFQPYDAHAASRDHEASRLLFAWARQASPEAAALHEDANDAARTLARLTGPRYHDRVAVALERAAVVLLSLTADDGFANLTQQGTVTKYARALVHAAARHEHEATRLRAVPETALPASTAQARRAGGETAR
jgi:hypothetical protein